MLTLSSLILLMAYTAHGFDGDQEMLLTYPQEALSAHVQKAHLPFSLIYVQVLYTTYLGAFSVVEVQAADVSCAWSSRRNSSESLSLMGSCPSALVGATIRNLLCLVVFCLLSKLGPRALGARKLWLRVCKGFPKNP